MTTLNLKRNHPAFGRLLPATTSLRDIAARTLDWPRQLLRAPVDALNRHRDEARLAADLAALDQHVLADLGLHRSLVDRSHFLAGRCG